jgi:hypothetical protein
VFTLRAHAFVAAPARNSPFRVYRCFVHSCPILRGELPFRSPLGLLVRGGDARRCFDFKIWGGMLILDLEPAPPPTWAMLVSVRLLLFFFLSLSLLDFLCFDFFGAVSVPITFPNAPSAGLARQRASSLSLPSASSWASSLIT